jgi:diguanylate cyclase (GGDEF)-like protein/PAS domain S-box-containing protein
MVTLLIIVIVVLIGLLVVMLSELKRRQSWLRDKQAKDSLRQSQQRFQGLVETLYDWVWEVDTQEHYTYVSPQVKNILGYEPQEILGKTPFDLMSPEEGKRVSGIFAALIKEWKPIAALENINIHKDGHQVVLETNGLPFYDADGNLKGYRGTDRDITNRKQAEEKIRHMANHDFLTDLPTMRLAKDRLAMAINMARRYKKRVAVMFIDMDGFKAINDSLGHDAGDYVLKEVAKRLAAGVRATSTVARVGGDEFLLIATELHSPDNAALVAEKVLRLISQPVSMNEKQAAVSASIGIALYPDDAEDIDGLIKMADEAMYKIKNSGKNGYGFAKY